MNRLDKLSDNFIVLQTIHYKPNLLTLTNLLKIETNT